MAKKDIKILVATHKEYNMPEDKIYVPIHVGAEGKKDLGLLKDNTGDNISIKNPNYCELTAMYWAWKNLKCDIIGLMHYRRYLSICDVKDVKKAKTIDDKFKLILTENEILTLLKDYDVLLPCTKLHTKNVYTKYAQQHYIKDLDNVKKIIEKDYSEMLNAFNEVMTEKKYAIGNMCVMKKELFDEYCEWLFELFEKLEKVTDMSDYSKLQQRLYGFLSERLFNIWLRYKNLNIKELTLVAMEHDNLKIIWNKSWHRLLHKKL